MISQTCKEKVFEIAKMKLNLLFLQLLIAGIQCAPHPRAHVDTPATHSTTSHRSVHESSTAKFHAGGNLFPPSILKHASPTTTAKATIKPKSLLPNQSPTPSISIQTSISASATIQIIPSSANTLTPSTTGVLLSSLETSGHATSAPIIAPSLPISIPQTRILVSLAASALPSPSALLSPSPNIFQQPISISPPPSIFPSRPDHPVPRLGISRSNSGPLQTNKFYANFFLGSQSAATWTHPYSLSYTPSFNPSTSPRTYPGLSISHLLSSQKVFGPTSSSTSSSSYYINPIGITSLFLSCTELPPSTSHLTTSSLTSFSASINLLPSPSSTLPLISFPLVQGMGFVTALYTSATPVLGSGVFFQSLALLPSPAGRSSITKYKIALADGSTWLLYATPSSSTSTSPLSLTLLSPSLIQGSAPFSGSIQIAKLPASYASSSEAETLHDTAAGAYARSASISGSVNGNTGSYTLTFEKGGLSEPTLLMYALPHHVESFDNATYCAVSQRVVLDTTTKGTATAVLSNSWTLLEPSLPNTMGFLPWSPARGSLNPSTISSAAKAVISNIAAVEVSQNMTMQTNLDSMYYSGKALAKFAGIVYTIHDIVGDVALAQAGLNKLKQSFERFSSNQQQFPLVYETAWSGLVSSASYTTLNSGADFGNTYYNDHHFHYSYFVYAAAIIGYLDPTWLASHKDYINTLVRDYANPSPLDPYFPVSRSFDWYHGHSWAHGLYETFDGKNEESSSEDSLSAYALKMWGHVTGDANMEARGNLQLAVTARSLQNYFLYESDNDVQPANFIGNKVSGILFENKIDHTTYFGGNAEFVQGIHMLPLLPHSTLTRTQRFVSEEWNTYFSNGRADAVVGGWKGILFGNLAIIDARSSWNFFARGDFDWSWLDGGASRTWYLAMAAGLGGAP
ncbi:glycosyl hydrolase family 81 protein [Rutstroemia sp. NJR-2017a BVV2]|nr:glycosyl hydrolase family 81 protein [Rutstroemia sp. NJR-2017a BVV2]